eukprot:147422-Rhodomonas_salina.2
MLASDPDPARLEMMSMCGCGRWMSMRMCGCGYANVNVGCCLRQGTASLSHTLAAFCRFQA